MDSKEKLIHCIWTIGFLIFCMVLLVTMNLGSRPDVANLISVGTGLVSLVVGIIAITYAFITNNSISETSARLKESSTTIQEVAKGVAISLENMGKELSPTLSDVQKKITELHAKGNASPQEPSTKTTLPQTGSSEKIDLDKLIEYFLSISSWSGLLTLYLIREANKKNLTVNLYAWSKTTNAVTSDYAFGFLVCTVAVGMVNYDRDEFTKTGSIKVTHFTKRLEDRLDKTINDNLCSEGIAIDEQKNRQTQKNATENYLRTLSGPTSTKI